MPMLSATHKYPARNGIINGRDGYKEVFFFAVESM